MPKTKSDVSPLPPAPSPEPVLALAIVTMRRMGVREHNLVALRIVGDKVVERHVIPESNYERLEGAINDFKRCATQMYRFGKWAELINVHVED